jgi:hypothetical protein
LFEARTEVAPTISEDLFRDVVLVVMTVVPVVVFLQDLRDRVIWVREAQNTQDMLRRLLRETLVMLLYLIALCLYLWLTWWILTMPLSEIKGR